MTITRSRLLTCLAVLWLLGPAAAPARAGDDAPARWRWPLTGHPVVLRGFDPPVHPWERGHRGVDLATRPGDLVLAGGAGLVRYAGMLAGRGVVSIVHGDLRTTYEPLTTPRPEGRGFQPSPAGVPVSPATAPGRTRSV